MSGGPGGTGTLRSGGTLGKPPLWLVHALGDSSRAFERILTNGLRASFELLAPDCPGAGQAPAQAHVADLDAVAEWLVRTIDHHTPCGPLGLVGHSLGAAVAVRAASRLGRVVGLFSIEGNLTAADAYLSGRAPAFENAEDYRDDLLVRVRAMAEAAASGRGEALWRYHQSLTLAVPEALWKIGLSAAAASRLDALGEEHRALPIPSLYYWSRQNTPPETHEYIRRHELRNVEFAGGHWPMIEQAQEMANEIAAFFQPLFLAREGAPAR